MAQVSTDCMLSEMFADGPHIDESFKYNLKSKTSAFIFQNDNSYFAVIFKIIPPCELYPVNMIKHKQTPIKITKKENQQKTNKNKMNKLAKSTFLTFLM